MTGHNVIKIIGVVAQIVSFGSTLALNWANNKDIEEKIAMKVAEALVKMKK